MPFKQQKKAAGYVPVEHVGLLRLKLRKAGYEEHTGPAVSREGEVATFRKTYRSGQQLKQNHVQVVGRGAKLAMYAHTEPHTDRLIDHAFSALFDEATHGKHEEESWPPKVRAPHGAAGPRRSSKTRDDPHRGLDRHRPGAERVHSLG